MLHRVVRQNGVPGWPVIRHECSDGASVHSCQQPVWLGVLCDSSTARCYLPRADTGSVHQQLFCTALGYSARQLVRSLSLLAVQAFLAASLKSDEELMDWFRQRLVWNDPAIVKDLVKNGLFYRIYTPQVSSSNDSGPTVLMCRWRLARFCIMDSIPACQCVIAHSA